MTVIDPPKLDLPDLQRQLVGRLDDLGRRIRGQLLVEGLARVLAIGLALALVSYGLDRWLRLGVVTRVILMLVGVAAFAIQAWRHLIIPLDLRLSPLDLASAMDRRSGGSAAQAMARSLTCSVASVLQLPELLRGPQAPSPAMVRAAVLRSHEALREARFDERLNTGRGRIAVAAVFALLLLAGTLVALGPSSTKLWFNRWFLGSAQSWPQRTYLYIDGLENNTLYVPRGEPAVLRAGVRSGSDEPDSVLVTIRDSSGTLSSAPMTRFAAGDFRHDLPPIQNDMQVSLAGGDDELGPITIHVIDRPRIDSLTLTSRHPTETQPKVFNFTGQEADVSFLPKTELELKFTANVPVAEARLKNILAKPGATPGPTAKSLRRLDARTFSIRWVHEQPVNLEIELVGQVAGLVSAPTPVAIGLKTDQPPRVSLAHTGVRARVTPQARIPLTVQARDDYGLAKVELAIKIEPPPGGTADPAGNTFGPAKPATAPAGPRESTVSLFTLAPPAVELETQHQHVVELAPLGLAPGSLVSVTARATDNCYTGSQTTASRTITFRVVTAEELFREILSRQQSERAKFRRQIDEAQKIQRDLAAAVSEESVTNAGRQHRVVQREVNRITETLRESLTEMKLNALGGQEAYDLMEQKILAPLKGLNTELMDPQRDALDRLGKPADPKRVSEAAGRQSQIVARMREVLAQMAQWDSFVDVINQLNEVIRIQQQVRQATEQMKNKDAESLFK